MNRRTFLASILAAGMAPAVVRAESLMRCFVRRESGLVVPQTVIVRGVENGAICEAMMFHRNLTEAEAQAIRENIYAFYGDSLADLHPQAKVIDLEHGQFYEVTEATKIVTRWQQDGKTYHATIDYPGAAQVGAASIGPNGTMHRTVEVEFTDDPYGFTVLPQSAS